MKFSMQFISYILYEVGTVTTIHRTTCSMFAWCANSLKVDSSCVMYVSNHVLNMHKDIT